MPKTNQIGIKEKRSLTIANELFQEGNRQDKAGRVLLACCPKSHKGKKGQQAVIPVKTGIHYFQFSISEILHHEGHEGLHNKSYSHFFKFHNSQLFLRMLRARRRNG